MVGGAGGGPKNLMTTPGPTASIPDPFDPDKVTRLLGMAEEGDTAAASELLPLVYDELRRLAESQLSRERGPITLQATALVHEAWIRLVGAAPADAKQWHGRAHFFNAAARAMRRILVDRSRSSNAAKRGGGAPHREFDEHVMTVHEDTPSTTNQPVDVLLLDHALKTLEAHDASQAEIVMLRYFAGLSIEETAAAVGRSTATVKREWSFARAWLRREIENARPDESVS